MLQKYNSVWGQSTFDVCLNTYGSLDPLYKMLQDSGVDNVNDEVKSNQEFLYDDSLVSEKDVSQSFLLNNTRYATSTGQKGSVYYTIKQPKPPVYIPPGITPGPPTPSTMYQQVSATYYTSGADGVTEIYPTDKDGLSMVGTDIIQIEKEIAPIKNTDWVWNKALGKLTLINGVSVDTGQTLHIIYGKMTSA